MITLTCDNCEKPFQVEADAQQGEKVSCPYCGDINRVPATAASAAAAPAIGKPMRDTPTAAMPGRAAAKHAEEQPEREVVVVRQAMFRAHPFWYSLMVLLILGGVVWAVIAATKPQWDRFHIYLGLSAAIMGLGWWLVWYAAPHRWVKLIITNKRTIRQEGIVVRKTSEVLHSHIRNVKIEQSVLQRLFGVGSIAIDSSGGSDAAPIEIEMSNVAKPYDVKAVIDQYRGI